MEPWLTQGVISGVIANGLTSIVAYIGSKTQKTVQQLFNKDPALNNILKKATESVSNATELIDEHQTEKLRFFLSSPDIEAIVRQIYASKLTSNKNDNHMEAIRAEFLACLSLHLDKPQKSIKDISDTLFEALLEVCERALTLAIDNGLLSAHDAKSSLRHSMVIDELAAIKKNLVFLAGTRKPDMQEILEFEKKYLQQIANRHGYITPPYFDAARKIPVDDIFVSPKFVKNRKEDTEEPKILTMQDFLSVIYRAVLLGNPGAGKSTFTFKLCHDLAAHYSERIFAKRQLTPILVVLRDYGAEKKAHNCSILQFIETMSNSKYQIKSPPCAFEYLMLNGRAVVIFDGLDELLDTSYRQEISCDIESFCTLYPSVPALVTSREVGYEQAPLSEKRFEVFHLAPFEEEQVKEYVKKWYVADPDLTTKQQIQKANAFLQESRNIPELRSNPLMLALLCNIYRGENYIPKNRPDVYEKCAVMLFERWDKSRGIHVPLPFEAHFRPAVMFLANWIYSNESLQGGVIERSLIAKATDYLCPRRFEDRDEAEKAAREFIEICRGRTWVFTDIGTTKDGERLYQFTHRTFLEYFNAVHLVRTYATPDDLGAFLLPKIARREWDVVAQLAFQVQNKNIEWAGEGLLTMLIKRASESEGKQQWNLLSFAARCLEFMVLSPKTIRDITTACIQRCIVWGIEQEKPAKAKHGFNSRYEPEELLRSLLNAASENRTAISDSLEKLFLETVNRGNELESLLALEIVSSFDSMNIFNQIFDLYSERLETLCQKYFGFCIIALRHEKVSIDYLIKWHGVESIFYEYSFIMFPGMRLLAPAEVLINNLDMYLRDERKRDLKNLQKLGRILLSTPPPLTRNYPFLLSWINLESESRISERRQPSLYSDCLFGAFVILAVKLEAIKDIKYCREVIELIKNNPNPVFGFRWILVARFEKIVRDKVQAEIDNFSFTPEQQSFIWQWIRREINLVQQ